ncbi:MAG: argB [Rickettsiaceae bacterium]|nr:argB [Rickettsiaceae bacterium]
MTKAQMTKVRITKDQMQQAKTLSEALPYMKQFSGETFVIKYGGSAMGDPELSKKFARDVVMMKQVGINPIIVHGGGPQISNMLEKLKIQSSFIDGLRVTDAATVEIVEMVLSGSINKQIVTDIMMAGGTAIGLSGKDGGLISARRLRRTKRDPDSNIEQILDLGFVGEPTDINPEALVLFEESDIIPVIAPIGRGSNGETYNINADSVAGAIASAIAAHKLIMLTDVPGLLDKEGNLVSEVTVAQAQKLMKNKTITGGMIPKIETCIKAVTNSVEAAHILDGRVPHVLLLEIFTAHGTGTMMLPS